MTTMTIPQRWGLDDFASVSPQFCSNSSSWPITATAGNALPTTRKENRFSPPVRRPMPFAAPPVNPHGKHGVVPSPPAPKSGGESGSPCSRSSSASSSGSCSLAERASAQSIDRPVLETARKHAPSTGFTPHRRYPRSAFTAAVISGAPKAAVPATSTFAP